MIVIQLIIYGFSCGFGFYLLRRNPAKTGLRFAGLGVLAYAGLLAADLIGGVPWRSVLLPLPAVFWCGAIVNLYTTHRILNAAVYGAAVAVIGLGLGSAALRPTLLIATGGATGIAFIGSLWQGWRTQQRIPVMILTATVFFLLGLGILIAPHSWFSIPPQWVIYAIGVDLVILGLGITALDAYDEGEAYWRDALHAMLGSAFIALIFSMQIVLIARDRGDIIRLLVVMLPTMIFVLIFYSGYQRRLDQLILPRIEQERQSLWAVAEALPRQKQHALEGMEIEEFTRLTRRALSHLGDLSRLASSPLLSLAIINQRVAPDAGTLIKAQMLRELLIEGIEQLKPLGEEAFGTTDAWRYYNALYYPYVVGIKPFSRQPQHDIDDNTRAAYRWFQSQVPERTLYNWQKKGAELVALWLWEQAKPHANKTPLLF